MTATAQDPAAQGGSTALARVFGQSRHELDRAWENFMAGAARETLPVRGAIVDSWERCRASSVSLGIHFAPRLHADTLDARRRDHRALLRASAETLADATNILSGTDAIMLVTDPDGIVLEEVGDRSVLHAGRDIALGRGGDWREGAAGTNGIGVALATVQPVLVHAGEHYCERMKGWSCAAAPIVDPADGSVAGILNFSARSQTANSQIFALAVLGARRIEQALLHQADRFRAQLLEIALEQGRRTPWDGLVAVDAKGRLAYASAQAARLLRDRLDLRLASTVPGQRAFATRPSLPEEWVRPIRVDGETAGTMIVIPAETAMAVGQRAAASRRRGNEADPARADFSGLVGKSPALAGAIERAGRLATADVPVLIEGETGVGKELFARAIHGLGRAAGPFVTFNCGVANREMIASELFGYARGAFTGASPEGRAGRFELADGGTLCLDEVGELPLDLQPVLLRALEEGVVTRIGEADARRVDVRIVAMTNRDLRAEVAAGRFRRDLYHRLAVATVTVPPLRERTGDVDLLLEHFAAKARTPLRFTAEALARIRAHDWPGNVRELRNLVETASLLAQGGLAGIDALPADLSAPRLPAPTSAPVADERTRIAEAIAMTAGNMSVACTILGMSRSTLYRRMDLYGLDRALLKSSRLRDIGGRA